MGFWGERKQWITQATRFVGVLAFAAGVASEKAPTSPYQPLSADQPQKHSLVLKHNPFTSNLVDQPLSADQPPVRPLVAGGTPVNPGDFPSLVAARITYDGTDSPWCTGSIVTNYCVKLAAHCVFESETPNNNPFALNLSDTGKIHTRVIAFPKDGSKDLTQRNQIRVAQAYISPNYPGGSQVSDKDGGYYQTEQPILLTSAMDFAIFPEPNQALPISTSVHFAGYGVGSNIRPAFGVGHTVDCRADYPGGLCVKEDIAEIAPGDSGGGVFPTNNHKLNYGPVSGLSQDANGEWRVVYASSTDPQNYAFDRQMMAICQNPSNKPDNFITDNPNVAWTGVTRAINGIQYAVIGHPALATITDQVINHTYNEKPTATGLVTNFRTEVTITDPSSCLSTDTASFEPISPNPLTTTKTITNSYAISTSGTLIPFTTDGTGNMFNFRLNPQNQACDQSAVHVQLSKSSIDYSITDKNVTRSTSQQSASVNTTEIQLLTPISVNLSAHTEITVPTQFPNDTIIVTRGDINATLLNTSYQKTFAIELPGRIVIIAPREIINLPTGFAEFQTRIPALVK